MARRKKAEPKRARGGAETELVLITGMSGSGKASVLKAFEDLGYYCVDNLPVGLIPRFAEMARASTDIQRTALVADVREGQRFGRLPGILKSVKKTLNTTVVFLEASDEALQRRFSETRRPHPMGRALPLKAGIRAERRRLRPIRALADMVVETSRFNVHELRAYVTEKFQRESADKQIRVSCVSFGYRHGVPQDADLVFDVRFLPNPHFVPQLRHHTGRHPKVARYVRSFPQTGEFIHRISELLVYLMPHYIREGKSYLNIAFGCTGGRHRSVTLAEALGRQLARQGHSVKISHRDLLKAG